jgi:hypothetical protein
MMTSPSRLLPLLLGAPAAVAAAVLVWQPWSDDHPLPEAEAAPSAIALCNVAITDIPAGVEVIEYPVAAALDNGRIYLIVAVPGPDGELGGRDPVSGRPVRKGFQAVIDPKTGDVVERFEDPSLSQGEATASEMKLDDALDRIVPLSSAPTFSAWPRTNTPLTKEKPETDTYDGGGGIKYREPDKGAGLIVVPINVHPSEGGGRLIARTCDSKVAIDRVFDETVGVVEVRLTQNDVVPAEREMFDRFLDEVEGLDR